MGSTLGLKKGNTSKEKKSEALEKEGDDLLTRKEKKKKRALKQKEGDSTPTRKEEKKKKALKQKKGEALTRKG